MTSLVGSLLMSFTVFAQNPALEFITGFRQRPVRIIVEASAQNASAFRSDRDMIQRALEEVEGLRQRLDIPSDLKIEVEDWTDLFALGHVLAVANEPDVVLSADHPALASIEALFGTVNTPGRNTANEMARRAVEPFRRNWLYSSSDAFVLNQIEQVLAEGLRWVEAWKLFMEFGTGFAPKISSEDYRTVILGDMWAGNPTNFNREMLLGKMASTFPPELIGRIEVPLLFKPLSNEAKTQIEKLRTDCREELVEQSESPATSDSES